MNKKEHPSRGSETASQYGNALTSSSRNTGKGGKETLQSHLGKSIAAHMLLYST